MRILHDCVSPNKRIVVAFNACARLTSLILSRRQIVCLHECVSPTAKMMLQVFPSRPTSCLLSRRIAWCACLCVAYQMESVVEVSIVFAHPTCFKVVIWRTVDHWTALPIIDAPLRTVLPFTLASACATHLLAREVAIWNICTTACAVPRKVRTYFIAASLLALHHILSAQSISIWSTLRATSRRSNPRPFLSCMCCLAQSTNTSHLSPFFVHHARKKRQQVTNYACAP